MKYFVLFISFVTALTGFSQVNHYKELYRPQFHFTPSVNWTNDPNGLVFYKGKYHLFYQYNPFGNVWGHMSWGHAVSTDLVHWKHLPVAIPEENGTMIFSGSAVVDERNNAGFANKQGEQPLIAIYTGHYIADTTNKENYLQSQNIAYSVDDGATWKKYKSNPVLDLQKKDFRDPCVFWYAPGKKWVMAVVLPQQHIVQFYGSPNLINWTHLSDFGPAGDVKDIWECPSLVQVPVIGTKQKKWVLFNSQQTTMQYFVGEFDGTKFTSQNPAENIYRPDYGPDYYAGITYNHLPNNHPPVLVGWANNWTYASTIPTYPWKSMMGLPRDLSLKKIDNEWLLFQKPTAAIYTLHSPAWQGNKINVEREKKIPVHSQQCELKLEWQPESNSVSGLQLAVGENKKLVIGYDAKENKLFLDRKNAGDTSFNKKFGELSYYETKLPLRGKKLRLHVFFDHSIVEVFANDGEAVMTMQIFPMPADDGIQLFSDGGKNNFENVQVWNMKSVW